MQEQSDEIIKGREVATKAFLRATYAFQLSNSSIAKILRVGDVTISNLIQNGVLLSQDTSEWERARAFIHLYNALADQLACNVDTMNLWLISYNNDLNGIPLSIIENNTEGLEIINDYLRSFRSYL